METSRKRVLAYILARKIQEKRVFSFHCSKSRELASKPRDKRHVVGFECGQGCIL